MNNNDAYQLNVFGQMLLPGKMSEHHFLLLADISPVHSEKVINALKDFLVFGYTRRESCERHDVSPGYFSGALKRFQRTHQSISQIIPFYISDVR